MKFFEYIGFAAYVLCALVVALFYGVIIAALYTPLILFVARLIGALTFR